MGGQRFVTTAQNVSTRFSFQLELSGLVTIPLGSSIDALYKSIPGYTQKIPAPVR